MAAGLAVNGADVQAGAAADAAKDVAAFGGEDIGAAVVDEDDVHLLGAVGLRRRFGAGDELGVNGELLCGGGAGEEVEEEAEVAVARDEFFDADECDVAFGGGEAEAGVALVGDEDEAAGFDGDEVAAGEADIGLEVFFAEEGAGAAGDGLRIVVVGSEALAFEGLGDLASVFVDDRADDVAWVVVVDLDDEFAEVCLQSFDTVFPQVGLEVDFLGDHGLGFDHFGGAAVLHDFEDGGVGVVGGGGPVDFDAVGLELGFDGGQVGVEVFERVLFDVAGELAEAVGIGEVVEEEFGALLVRGLRGLVNGGALVGREGGGEGVERLAHGLGTKKEVNHGWTRMNTDGEPGRG